MPLDVSHLPASLHPYLWGGTAAMVAEASTFPIGEPTEWTTSLDAQSVHVWAKAQSGGQCCGPHCIQRFLP